MLFLVWNSVFSFFFFLAMRRHKPKPGWCFMRTIDREAHADELSRDSAVNEAGYSRDPGGITPHSSLISRKAAWNPNAILPDECTLSVSLLSLSSFCLSLTPLLSHSHSVFWAWWMQSESINLFPCWIPDKIYKDKLNKLLMGWPISLCVCMCWIDCVAVCLVGHMTFNSCIVICMHMYVARLFHENATFFYFVNLKCTLFFFLLNFYDFSYDCCVIET